jgi:hypothetical protein
MEDRDRRDLLLQDVPTRLRASLKRQDDKIGDLTLIVEQCASWVPGNATELPLLRLLIENAVELADGSHLADELRTILADIFPPSPAAPSERPPCPYPGLQTFKTEQASDFFWRDVEIARLKALVEERPLVLIVGPSGSGKSSLVFAGLLPTIGPAWDVRTLRPGPDPCFALAARLGAPEAAATDPAALSAAVAAQLQAAPGQRRLLVVDQAEEVFTRTTDRDAQTTFFAALRALAALEACRIVLTLRADFYGDLMASALWPVPPDDRVEIAPLRGDALRAAIERPGARVGLTLDPALVRRLADDMAREPGPPPPGAGDPAVALDRRPDPGRLRGPGPR